MKSWPKVKLGKVIICSNFVLSPLFGPKIQFLSLFSLPYIYLPLFTYIWLYLGLMTLIWSYLSFIALILPYVPYSPYICMLLLRLHLQNFRAIGPLFMDILHIKDLGDTSIVNKCSLGANLVIDNFFYVASGSPLYKIWKQSDYYLGDIAFWRFGGYKCRLAAHTVVLVLRGHHISIATYLRGVSTLI